MKNNICFSHIFSIFNYWTSTRESIAAFWGWNKASWNILYEIFCFLSYEQLKEMKASLICLWRSGGRLNKSAIKRRTCSAIHRAIENEFSSLLIKRDDVKWCVTFTVTTQISLLTSHWIQIAGFLSKENPRRLFVMLNRRIVTFSLVWLIADRKSPL